MPERTGSDCPSTSDEAIDYQGMEGGDQLQAMGLDARKWADAFIQLNPDVFVNHGTMVAWFANAIEHTKDVIRGTPINGDHAQFLID